MRLTMLLDMAAEGFGDRRVVGTAAAGMTAHELRGRALAGARLLERGGADALAYVATNGPAYPAAMFAAACAGLPLVPLNYRLGEAQLGHLLARHPRALVIADQRVRPIIERAGLEQLSTADWLDLTAPGAERAAAPAPADPAGDGPPAVIIYTSGTTAAPKGVLLRHRHLVSYVLGTTEFAAADEEDVALICVPPYHIAAVANVISNLLPGWTVLWRTGFGCARHGRSWPTSTSEASAAACGSPAPTARTTPTARSAPMHCGGWNSSPSRRTRHRRARCSRRCRGWSSGSRLRSVTG
jgi:acyl-CoA synthetase (AMP-forming)/AMP-acid ligase II